MKIGRLQLVVLLVVGVILVGAGYTLASIRQDAQQVPIEIIPPQPSATSLPEATLASPAPPQSPRVFVSGAVVNPAVYELPPGSIIDQAVKAAGGFVSGADTAAINLAQPVVDGMQIHVPQLDEAVSTPAGINLPATTIPGGDRMGGITTEGLININTADQADLEMLPGIGPSIAGDIIIYREANGPFATIEAIMEVPGIGDGRFETIRELITVGP
jgi:competence protein ComEA